MKRIGVGQPERESDMGRKKPPGLGRITGTTKKFGDLTTEEMLIAAARENIRLYGTLTPPYEALLPVMQATCPRCEHTGNVLKDFGLKTVEGQSRPQSWCRNCRNGREAHPTRWGL